MKGMRYIGGRRAGRVADLEAAFLADVETVAAENGACYVEIGDEVSDVFVGKLVALGVVVRRVSTLGARAVLIEVIDDPNLTST